jgi:hypothetical protein
VFPDDTTLKRCSKCGELKPLDQFTKDRTNADGRRTQCKECKHKDENERYQQNAERKREYRQQNAERIRERQREYTAAHRESIRENNNRWRQEHPDQNREHRRRYLEKHREEINEKARLRRPINQAKQSERNRQWKIANPDRVRVNHNRRRARKRDLADTFTASDWSIALRHFGNACAACGQGLMFYSHQDHWIPITSEDCPGTVPHNMVPLCSTCNISKHDTMPAEWLTKKFGLRKGRSILRRIEAFLNSRKPAEGAA